MPLEIWHESHEEPKDKEIPAVWSRSPERPLPQPRIPTDQSKPPKRPYYMYEADSSPAERFWALGKRLAEFGELFRAAGHGEGLLLFVQADEPELIPIQKGSQLLPILIDLLDIEVVVDGKPKGGRVPPADLAAMLKSDTFLQAFLPLDKLLLRPTYLPTEKRELPAPGYHDCGQGNRLLYTGPLANVALGQDAVNRFLDAMAFKEEADRTNAVAAGLTVHLRQLFPGEKPMFVATANKSHGGKDTVLDFIVGGERRVKVTYEPTDWAFQKAIVEGFRDEPDANVLDIENARLGGTNAEIKSGYLERLLHDRHPRMHAVNAGPAYRRAADFVVVVSTNDARFSTDLMNRSVSIRLEAVGDVFNRTSSIGNPKLEYLPRMRERIAAEMRGMIERWRGQGMPCDMTVRHALSPWARTLGGILMVNGYQEFLGNIIERKAEDNPLRSALAILGNSCPGEWLRACEWATKIIKLGIVKALIQPADRETGASLTRGVGVVLSRHKLETFSLETDEEVVTLRLEKTRQRFNGEPETRYRFVVLKRVAHPVDVDPTKM